jgi:type I restriction enzyme R subunit
VAKDYCQHLEFFGANPEFKEASSAKSLSERLFAARLDLLRGLDVKHSKEGGFPERRQEAFRPENGDAPPGEDAIRADALTTSTR